MPRLRLAVVIPYFEAREPLELTLQALAAQTYPGVLTEVIVADDGSEPPLRLPHRHLGLDVRVVRQQRQGFGAGRARNLGASATTADILVFLDADMIPEPSHLAAHARWHHACEQAAVIGVRRHVDASGITAEAIGAAARSGDLAPVFAGVPEQVPQWLEGHFQRTDELTSDHDDLFRAVTSGNLSVGAEYFRQVGGFDSSFDSWGGEDTELGYRLFVAGGVLVLERMARCWHQGDGHEPSSDEQRSLDRQRSRLAHLIAHRGFRHTAPGRTYEVPRVAVTVDVGSQARDAVLATVESVLASDLYDLVVVLDIPDEHPDAIWLTHQFGCDSRVLLDGQARPWQIPYGISIPAGVTVEQSSVSDLIGRLESSTSPLGVIDVTVPRRRPRDVRLRAWSSRAVGRVSDGPTDDVRPLLDAAAELFGTLWLSGYDVGVRWHRGETEPPLASAAAPGGARDAQIEAHDLWRMLATLTEEQQRLVMSTAKVALTQLSPRQLRILLRVGRRLLAFLGAVAALLGVRSVGGLRRASVRLAHAALPWSVVRAGRRVWATPDSS